MASSSLQELIAGCQKERSNTRLSQDKRTPSCAEIFRRAFDNDQDAWTAVHEIFVSLFQSWGRRAAAVGDVPSDIVDDAINISWAIFSRAAPEKASNLIIDDTIGRALAYMRTILKREVMRLGKANSSKNILLSSLESEDNNYEFLVDESDIEEIVQDRIYLEKVLELIRALLKEEKEEIIYRYLLLLGWKPSQIYTEFSAIFLDVGEVNKVALRIRRRICADPELSKIRHERFGTRKNQKDDTSHKIEIHDHQDDLPMNYNNLCALEESQLLDYVLGIAPLELRIAVEQSPACRAAAEQLAREIAAFQHLLYRAECPTVEELVDYQEKRLEATAHLIVFRHVQTCPACQQNIAMFVAMDSVPLEPESGLLRQFSEALFQSSLSLTFAARGGGIYRTSQIQIDISTDLTSDELRSWSVYGDVRSSDGKRLPNLLQAASLERLDRPNSQVVEGQVDSDGSFVFEGMAEGTYRLHLLMPDEEIYIRSIIVGD